MAVLVNMNSKGGKKTMFMFVYDVYIIWLIITFTSYLSDTTILIVDFIWVSPELAYHKGSQYVEKDTQKMPFLYIEGPKYVSFDNKTLNLKAFVHILTTTIAISHFSACLLWRPKINF